MAKKPRNKISKREKIRMPLPSYKVGPNASEVDLLGAEVGLSF
jgi:hypothetical protein